MRYSLILLLSLLLPTVCSGAANLARHTIPEHRLKVEIVAVDSNVEIHAQAIVHRLRSSEQLNLRFLILDPETVSEARAGVVPLEEASPKNTPNTNLYQPEMTLRVMSHNEGGRICVTVLGVAPGTDTVMLPATSVSAKEQEDIDAPTGNLVRAILEAYPRIAGAILEIDGNRLVTSLTSRSGARPNMPCVVLTSREIKHPRTGILLGIQEVVVCEGMFTEVDEAGAIAVIELESPEDASVEPGMKIQVK